MSDTLTMISQVQTWLSEHDPKIEIHALFDLSDLNWVEIIELRDLGTMLEVKYQGLNFSSYLRGETEMVCGHSALKAIRRRKKADYFTDSEEFAAAVTI